MRVTLLGTGSADGWPSAFCECDSCAQERAAGRSRRPSSALVDGLILVDPGPAAPHAASAAGTSLRAVEHVLVTHGHPDHLDPSFLLARRWAHEQEALHVWGPGHAIDLCRHWIGPDDPVSLHVISAGDRLALPTVAGRYRGVVLPAAHSSGNGDRLAEEAVLFDVTAPDGSRLLYATDTGPLAASVIAQVDGPVDILLVDQTFGDTLDHGTGHLDLATLPITIEALRAGGVVTDTTTVVATHLSHHNPPTPVLRERLGRLGVRLPADFDVIHSHGAAARRMLVIGGARSGKSAFAERTADAWSRHVVYVATGGDRPDDPEWLARIALHRGRRPARWSTVETVDVAAALAAAAAGSVVLVDCLTLWLTRVLDGLDAWQSDATAGVHEAAMASATALTDALRACAADVVLVTNEVGWGVVPATPAGRLFRDIMGRVNAAVAQACDQSVLVVAGRGQALSGLPTTSREPT